MLSNNSFAWCEFSYTKTKVIIIKSLSVLWKRFSPGSLKWASMSLCDSLINPHPLHLALLLSWMDLFIEMLSKKVFKPKNLSIILKRYKVSQDLFDFNLQTQSGILRYKNRLTLVKSKLHPPVTPYEYLQLIWISIAQPCRGFLCEREILRKSEPLALRKIQDLPHIRKFVCRTRGSKR